MSKEHVPQPSPTSPTSPTNQLGDRPVSPPAERRIELTTSKVTAGALAAATAAAAGSAFGAAGTVAGAAAGSVVSTVGAAVYQRSLERTGDSVRTRLQSRGVALPTRLLAGVAAVVFVLGLLLVTGFEWVKGSPLSGGQGGTSIGRVLGQQGEVASPTTTQAPAETSAPRPTDSAEPSAEPSPTAAPQTAVTSTLNPVLPPVLAPTG